MLCCLCKEREAKVHLTTQFCGPPKTPENLVAKIDLCEDCARKHGVNDPVGFSLEGLITAVKQAQSG
jgi:protein-arginine kinase activator protein McsA